MKMGRKRFHGLLLAMALLVGCGTSVPLVVKKPAEVNMVAARRIAVMDFGYRVQGIVYLSFADVFRAALLRAYNLPLSARQTIEERIAQYATDKLIISLLDTDYFEIVSPRHVSAALPRVIDSRLSPVQVGNLVGAQAIIVGDIDAMGTRDETIRETYTVKDKKTGKPITRVRRYLERTASLQLSYRVVNVETGAILATKHLSGTKKDRKRIGNDSLKSPLSLYQEIIDSILPQVAKQLAPYEVLEYRFLLEDESEDLRMEKADGFVREGIYSKALELFLEVWNETGNPAAGFNAAIMYEALGDIDMGIATMEDTMDAIGGPRSVQRRVMGEYNRLLRTRDEMKQVSEQFAPTNGDS